MTVFSKELPKYRIASTEHGDTMQSIASRELGSANRWAELVWINSLSWPYITDDPARVTDGVLLSGGFIKIPAPTGVNSRSAETGQVFERDCVMINRTLRDDGNGDFAIVTGSANLSQQLLHRIVTPRGQARRHPRYGCLVHRLIGKIGGLAANLLATEYIKSTLLSDYRVNSVESATATIVGDTVTVEARAMTIAGGAVDVISG